MTTNLQARNHHLGHGGGRSTCTLSCPSVVNFVDVRPREPILEPSIYTLQSHSTLKLKFHGTSFSRSILVTSSRGCLQQVVRVVLVDFGERHRHTDKRAALHRSRPPADQGGKRVASWTGKSPTRPTRTTCCGHPSEDVTRMLRGKRSRGIQSKSSSFIHSLAT